MIVAWLPYWIPLLIELAIVIWLTLKLIGVLRTMAAAQQGILAKLNDIDQRLAAMGVRPPDPR
jgi:hypothetical protein